MPVPKVDRGADFADGVAYVGGRLMSGLVEITDDLGALDREGLWVVVGTFEGAWTCARFERAERRPFPGGSWHGPDAESWTTSLDESAYRAGVQSLRSRIAAGDVYQANLCRVLSAPMPAGGADVLGLAAILARGNPAPFAAAVRLPGVWVCSASPELYLRRRGAIVESWPIKGTARSPEQMLDKDHAENVMIVDLVRNDLGQVGQTGSVEVPVLCQVEPHPGLVHLVSKVQAHLRADVSWAELIAATFPPGSVTGAPKSGALQLIRELEPVPRGPYCGAVGWVDADTGDGELAVGIRTFWLDGEWLRFGTGAGITWGSDPAAEWAETRLKASRLVALASAPSVGESRSPAGRKPATTVGGEAR